MRQLFLLLCLGTSAWWQLYGQEPPAQEGKGLVLRVGLGVVPAPQFPELGRRFWVRAGERQEMLRGPLTISSQPPAGAAQVGVFGMEANAAALATRLQAQGFAVQLASQQGRFQVLVLPEQGQGKEGLLSALAAWGVEAIWVRVASGKLTVQGGEGGELEAEELGIWPAEPQPVQVGGRRYRGSFAVLAGESGPVVVNLVALEDYLLGVVPSEMPFSHLEALKAQAVAARSYALSRLGAHGREGYDLCDREHCQVYGGVAAETLLASKAVQETAGLVLLFAGKPARAFFHSTCGGHTEPAEAALSASPVPYLPGVPCRGETVSLGRPGEVLQPIPSPGGFLAQKLAAALGASTPLGLAQRLGGPGKTLPEALGLPDLPGFFGKASWEEVLAAFELLPQGVATQGKGDAWERVLQLARLAGTVQGRRGTVVPGEGGPRWVEAQGSEARPTAGLTVLWDRGGTFFAGPGEALAGSDATLWCAGDACPVLEVRAAAAADERSRFRQWVRELSAGELAQRLGKPQVTGVVVRERTGSGRAAQVEVLGPFGRATFTGPEFRRLLGLPSAWFTVGARRGAEGPVFRFFGRGWGHGVGLCQNGAYGLALGGYPFQKILAHYYPGTSLGQYPAAGEERREERP